MAIPVSGGVGLPGRPAAKAAPKPIYTGGGWAALGNPANSYQNAQQYLAAVNKTAQNPAGGRPPNLPIPGPRPSAPTTPAAPGAPGAPVPPVAPAPSPLDSTYFANVAENQFKTGNQINALDLQGTQNDTALQTALGQLAYQQPRDSLKLEEAANRGGSLYSQSYDAQQADLGHTYVTKQQAAQTSHDTTHDKLAAQIAALQQGIPIYNADQAALSAGRAATAASNDPTLGQSTAGVNTTPGQVTAGSQIGINRAGNNPAAPKKTGGRIPTVKPKRVSSGAKALQKAVGQKLKSGPVLKPKPVPGRVGLGSIHSQPVTRRY